MAQIAFNYTIQSRCFGIHFLKRISDGYIVCWLYRLLVITPSSRMCKLNMCKHNMASIDHGWLVQFLWWARPQIWGFFELIWGIFSHLGDFFNRPANFSARICEKWSKLRKSFGKTLKKLECEFTQRASGSPCLLVYTCLLVFTQVPGSAAWRMLAKPIAPCDGSSHSSRMHSCPSWHRP